MKKKYLLYAAGLVAGFVVLAGLYAGYVYASTPEHLRKPAFQHYHFRTQILVDGQAVNFAEDKYQQVYDKGSCSTDLAATPIHFHDHVDQMTHIHWDGMTGGEFLKYYGWNFIGGDDQSLGYRYDQGMVRPHKIPVAGNLLPGRPANANYYVYVGDAQRHERKDWNNFLNQDFETFFGKQSRIGGEEITSAIQNWLFPKASAHSGENHGHVAGEETKSDEDLQRINNLLGNVVIFVQEKEPTEDQVKQRFENLVPLQDSTCGG